MLFTRKKTKPKIYGLVFYSVENDYDVNTRDDSLIQGIFREPEREIKNAKP